MIESRLDNVKKSYTKRLLESLVFSNPYSRGRRARSAKTAKRVDYATNKFVENSGKN
jgi:hypothetical protein